MQRRGTESTNPPPPLFLSPTKAQTLQLPIDYRVLFDKDRNQNFKSNKTKPVFIVVFLLRCGLCVYGREGGCTCTQRPSLILAFLICNPWKSTCNSLEIRCDTFVLQSYMLDFQWFKRTGYMCNLIAWGPVDMEPLEKALVIALKFDVILLFYRVTCKSLSDLNERGTCATPLLEAL